MLLYFKFTSLLYSVSELCFILVCQDEDEDEKDKGETAADGAAKTKKKKKKKKKAAEEGGAAGQVTASENTHTNTQSSDLSD